MPLSVQLTVVPKDRQPSVKGEAKPRECDPPTLDPTKQKKKNKDRSSEAQGFSDEPAKASPRQPDEEDELEAEEGYYPHEEGGITDEVEEMDLKDLEISRPSKKKGMNHSYASSHSGGSSSASLNYKLGSSSRSSSITHDPIDDDFYDIQLVSTGKYSRKATWDDIATFAGMDNVDSETLKTWLHSYLQQNFPKQLNKPNCIPRTAHIQDDVKKGFSAFEPYGWQVVKLQIQPGLIDIKDQYTDEVTLERFQLNYETDMQQALIEKGDKQVMSYLKKGPMKGHPLAARVFQKSNKLQEDLQLLTEFRGMEGIALQLGNNQCKAEQNDVTGEIIWKDTNKLRTLLYGMPFPKKTGKGVSRTVSVVALESYMRARVYYKASFTGSVSTDHGNDQFDGRRYWNWDLKYLLRYNGIPNAQVMYQDIEVKFYSRIQYAMENEDWEWINKGGSWVKQKLVNNNNKTTAA